MVKKEILFIGGQNDVESMLCLVKNDVMVL